MLTFFKKTIIATLVFLPFISLAQYEDIDQDIDDAFAVTGSGGFWDLFYIVRDILDQVIILLIGFAVVFFLYGIVKYIGSADDEENRKKAKSIMIYGIIGLFVMVSFWGFVNILVITFQLDTTPVVNVPYFPPEGGESFDGDATTGN